MVPVNRPATEEELEAYKTALTLREFVDPRNFVRHFLALLSGTIPSEALESSVAAELETRGLKLIKLLAHGAHALAGTTPDNVVVKLTFDETDAIACKRVAGIAFKNVADVYEAAILNPPDAWRPLGLIFQQYADWPGLPKPGDDEDLDKLVSDQSYKHKVWKIFQHHVTGKEAEKIAGKATRSLVRLLEKDGRREFLEIANGLQELMEHGVYVVDPNSTNVSSTADGMKLIDLGMSYTKP